MFTGVRLVNIHASRSNKKIVFGSIWILGLFVLVCQKWHWNFDRDYIESVALRSVEIFTILTHDHR